MLLDTKLKSHFRALQATFPSLHSLSYRWSARTGTFNLCSINSVGIGGCGIWANEYDCKSWLVEANLKQHEVEPIYNCASSRELNLFLVHLYFGQAEVTVTL